VRIVVFVVNGHQDGCVDGEKFIAEIKHTNIFDGITRWKEVSDPRCGKID